MTRENLKKIIEGITDEQISAVLDINTTDIGKAKKDYDDLTKRVGTLEGEKKDLEGTITNLKNNAKDGEDYKKLYEDLKDDIEEKERNAQKDREDKDLTAAIEAVFGDREFSSDYVRKGIIADMKAEIAKPDNKGKGYAEIFEGLTKDKEGIFKNPNPPANMPGMGKNAPTNITREQFAKMGYAARAELYSTNKELYDQLNKEE
nr:MAG TPA: minor structural protein [Caudoviricetes sp.]